MGSLIVVDIADQKVASAPNILVTYALGSCVGVCLYDPLRKMGGLAHIFLPKAFGEIGRKEVYKFADLAIEELVHTMTVMGCSALRMTAKIAGGASLFKFQANDIGGRNVEAVKEELSKLRIHIVAEDTGLNYGRTVELDTENGMMKVKTVGKGIKAI